MFWLFGQEVCSSLTPWPEIKPTPPALEDKALTSGPPGKSLKVIKTSIFPKLIYDRFSIVLVKITGEYIIEIDQLILNFIQEYRNVKLPK